MLVALFLSVPVRAVAWTVALIWMGSACILNARQCGRTHCPYTGPYYLAMIIPVLAIASSSASANVYGCIVLSPHRLYGQNNYVTTLPPLGAVEAARVTVATLGQNAF